MAFMAVLLLQSAYSLFVPPASGELAGDIDIIVRTSSAAIFGYFLSANFVRRASLPREPSAPLPCGEEPAEHLLSQPAAAAQAGEPEVPGMAGTASGGPRAQKAPEPPPAANCLQVAAATGIGLFCLFTLLLLRNTPLGNTALEAQPDRLTATVAQFRDFVSGCVGFLIGCPTHAAASQS